MKYEYPMSLTSQFYFCGIPFRLDAYRGCPARCLYCFVNSRSGNYSHKIQYADPQLIRKWFNLALDELIEPSNILVELLRRRVPLHFGGMSDPFLIPDNHQNITLDILKILDEYRYPTLISTKYNIIDNDEISKIVLGKSHFAIQISFSTFNDYIASLVEPYAPPPSRRIQGASVAIRSGNWVACRLQPYFPNQDIDKLISFISYIGFRHITIEHFKLPSDFIIDIKALNSAFNIDLLTFFPKGKRIRRGREFEMPNEIRLEGIKSFLKAASKNQISIGIGDNGFQHLSTSPCCCGIDSLPDFENWFKHNVTVAIWRARKHNIIDYRLISDEWAPKSNISRMINSKVRLRNSFNNVKNHLKMQWDYNRQFSPKMFYNVISERNKYSYDYYFKEI